MAEEEKRVERDEGTSVGRGIANVAGRMGEGVIDALAQRVPLLGAPLQAAFETPDYQDRQMRREKAKLDLIYAQQRNKEFEENAGARKAGSKADQMRAEEFISGAGDREAERELRKRQLALANKSMDAAEENLPSEIELNKTRTQAEISKAKLAQQQADGQYMSQRIAGLTKNFTEEMGKNPAFSTMSFGDLDDSTKSPQVQNYMKARFYLEEVQGIAKGDQAAFGRMDRAIRGEGWSLVDGEDGIKYLDMGDGERIPATKDGIDRIMGYVSKEAAAEMSTRAKISDGATKGNPVLRSIAERTKALMPYNENNATNSYRVVEGVMNRASEEEKGWHMFNQAIKDYRSSGLPTEEKMEGLAVCMDFLPKMGYKLDTGGVDPKNPSPENVKFIDLKNKRTLTFNEFADICKGNDRLGERLDREIGMRQYRYLQKTAVQALSGAEARSLVNPPGAAVSKKKGSGKGNSSGGEEGEKEDPDNALHADLSDAYGEEYSSLPKKKQQKLIGAKREWDVDRDVVLEKYGVTTVIDLPDDGLQKLEDSWGKLMNEAELSPKIFYSPVDSIRRQRDIKRRKTETAEAEAAVEKSEEFNDDYDNNYHGLEDEEDRGAAFRRNYRLGRERSHRDMVKTQNDSEIRRHETALHRRGK